MRKVLIAVMLFALGACTNSADLAEGPVPLGDFNLEHNVVVANSANKGPLSRDASKEELANALKSAIAERFDRYDGDRLYHFGVSIDGYVLAAPGIPVVMSPKSIMMVSLTVWDDAANAKLNHEKHQITVFESLGAGSIVGSGYTQSAEEQLKNLSQNVAKEIEKYLSAQMKKEGWFTGAGTSEN